MMQLSSPPQPKVTKLNTLTQDLSEPIKQIVAANHLFHFGDLLLLILDQLGGLVDVILS
jgi:hypothetical protein